MNTFMSSRDNLGNHLGIILTTLFTTIRGGSANVYCKRDRMER
jgi:hypothetical protein